MKFLPTADMWTPPPIQTLCHVLSLLNLREGIYDPVSVTRIAFKD